jgi:hypothetical protein
MEPYPTSNLVKQDLMKILRKISFVDKIIFGKLNYNLKSSRTNNNQEFYQQCANTVIEFCRDKKIEYHIKYGTQKKDDRRTERIFVRNIVGARYNVKQLPLSI